MESIMELDELKSAWQSIDRRLQQQNALSLHALRQGTTQRMHSNLRPLVWGQATQMLIGAAGLLALAPIWISHRDDIAVLICGLVVHAYCIGLIVVGAVVQAQIARIDYTAPVLAIQRQLLQLRRTYAIWGALVVGLPWWFLTAPLLVVLTRGTIMTSAPSVIWIQLAIGAVGLVATYWFHSWSHRPQRAQLARKLDDSTAGGSIRRAQAALDEIARFEQE
ncbi:MAG: hypothetical protein ABI748_06580 [Dokdonella sp.]